MTLLFENIWNQRAQVAMRTGRENTMMRLLECLMALVLVAAVSSAIAQPVPAKGIRIVVPSTPGAFNDVIARALVQGFSEGYAPGSYIDNRPGAGTVIATEAVARASPDGTTMLVVSFPFSVLGALYPNARIDVLRDFVALNHVASAPALLVASAASPYRSVKDLAEAAQAKPDAVLYASTSNGSSGHLFMELFKSLTRVSLVHVPYKGNAPAMIDLISGRVPVMFANLPNALAQVKAGKLRGLAITAAKRFSVVPDVPTMAEAGVSDFEANIWWGVVAPAVTPKDVVAKQSIEINRILATNAVRALFESQDVQLVLSTPEASGNYIRSQVALWSQVVRDAKIKAD